MESGSLNLPEPSDLHRPVMGMLLSSFIYYSFRKLTTRMLISVYSVLISNEIIFLVKPINLVKRIITLFDDCWLPLPVALFIVLTYHNQSFTHTCNCSGGRWQMRFVILTRTPLMWCYHCCHICNTREPIMTDKQMVLCQLKLNCIVKLQRTHTIM
jgi:hypothetical protein